MLKIVALVSFATTVSGEETKEVKWHTTGYLCGKNQKKLENGNTAECNPDDDAAPCCSKWGYCGITPEHCECEGCMDYRGRDCYEQDIDYAIEEKMTAKEFVGSWVYATNLTNQWAKNAKTCQNECDLYNTADNGIRPPAAWRYFWLLPGWKKSTALRRCTHWTFVHTVVYGKGGDCYLKYFPASRKPSGTPRTMQKTESGPAKCPTA